MLHSFFGDDESPTIQIWLIRAAERGYPINVSSNRHSGGNAAFDAAEFFSTKLTASRFEALEEFFLLGGQE
jgi:hypothetical protein